MKIRTHPVVVFLATIAFLSVMPISSRAEDAAFHKAPASAKKLTNPYSGQPQAVEAGGKLYANTCSKCHGANGQGTGNVPPLTEGPTQSASDGEIFWFITKGDINNGMPSWKALPRQQRWQVVSFVKALPNAPKAETAAATGSTAADDAKLAPPQAPFTDYRFEQPGTFRKITMHDLPQPYASRSSNNGPSVVPRPQDAWPKAPAGFKVEQYATDLDNPRLITTAPNGDYFVAESDAGKILAFRGITVTASLSRWRCLPLG